MIFLYSAEQSGLRSTDLNAILLFDSIVTGAIGPVANATTYIYIYILYVLYHYILKVVHSQKKKDKIIYATYETKKKKNRIKHLQYNNSVVIMACFVSEIGKFIIV